MTPAEASDTTTVCGSSGEDEVQAAQRGQVKAQIIKRPAANSTAFPSKGKAERTAFTRTRKLSPLCTTSLLFVSPGLPVPRGGLGGRSRIEFIMSPPLPAAT